VTVDTPGAEPAPSDNVVRVSFGQQREQCEVKQTLVAKCFHNRYGIEIDAELRTVHCAKCQTQLDPLQVLLDYADGERSWRGWIRECDEKRRGLEQLREEERKVKARTKAASRKAAAAAVEAERERGERERITILQAARDIAASARRIERAVTRRMNP
jgi:hypothetical protein